MQIFRTRGAALGLLKR